MRRLHVLVTTFLLLAAAAVGAGPKPLKVFIPAGQYRALIGIVHETLDNLKKHCPSYDEKAGYEVAA